MYAKVKQADEMASCVASVAPNLFVGFSFPSGPVGALRIRRS